MRINNILINPIITEKSMSKTDSNWYTFKVALDTPKNVVANELKRLYNVDVIDAKSMIMPGKKRRVLKTRLQTKTNNWKKVVVKLKDGQHIDLFPKEK